MDSSVVLAVVMTLSAIGAIAGFAHELQRFPSGDDEDSNGD